MRIDQDLFDLIVEEQARLRRAQGGKKPSYSEVLRRMWAAYQHQSGESTPTLHAVPPPEDPALAPANDYERRVLVATLKFIRDKQSFKHFKELLHDLLEIQPEPKRKDAVKQGRKKVG